MEKERTKPQTADPKFRPLQMVRIKTDAEATMKDPGLPVPVKSSLGMTGVVEMEGKIYVYGPEGDAAIEQVYFVRIDGIGPVLTGEGWLMDA